MRSVLRTYRIRPIGSPCAEFEPGHNCLQPVSWVTTARGGFLPPLRFTFRSSMNLPSDLKYARTHEWVRLDGDTVVVGITDPAQEMLGDVVFVGDVKVGAQLRAGDVAGLVESVKAASDMPPSMGRLSRSTRNSRPHRSVSIPTPMRRGFSRCVWPALRGWVTCSQPTTTEGLSSPARSHWVSPHFH